MLCLGIDTATARGSVALAGRERTECEAHLEARAWHARDLLERIERMLSEAGRTPADLTGIGVAIGPGSFTGVRVGMATGKGMAYALGIGLAGISTLEALARAAPDEPDPRRRRICPVISAGRGEVYVAEFARAGETLERLSADRLRRPEALDADLGGAVCLIGDGAGLVVEAARGRAGGGADVIEPGPPLAGAIARWAACRIRPERGYEIGSLVPNYVRPSDAEATPRRH
jgi:tRNA threonylcarbamoyladenosine biosynthesis protein TsaB